MGQTNTGSSNRTTALRLSSIIVILAAVASFSGLFLNIYRDNTLVTAAFRGNDLITLVLAVPLLIASLIYARRGSILALLGWLGMLGYMLYNYAFYLFGAAFNLCFLAYVGILALSIWALIFTLSEVDALALKASFKTRTPVRWIAGFMIGFAGLLGLLWIAMTVGFMITGEVPAAITQTGHPTGVVFALDLSLLVPGFLVGGLWLWQRRAWGYVLAAIMLIKGPTYALALIFMSVFAAAAGVPNAWDMAWLWAVLGLGALLAAAGLLGNLGKTA